MPPRLFTDAQLSQKDIDTVKRFLRFKLGGYCIAIKDIRAGNALYRGVVCDPIPTTVARISYPPPDAVTRLGRANRVNASIFYASAAGPACFYEINAAPGQRIAMSEWVVSKPLWMHNLGFHPTALKRLGVTNLESRALFVAPIPNETKANARLRLQLSLAFTERVTADELYRYKQSIAIFENLFDGADPLPGLPGGGGIKRAAGAAYPAMGLRGMADNLAIIPDCVDRGLSLKSVRYVHVEAVDAANSAYTLLTVAVSKSIQNGKIEWDYLTAPEIERRTFIALENGQWVMRNGRGEIYFRR